MSIVEKGSGAEPEAALQMARSLFVSLAGRSPSDPLWVV